MRSPRAATSPSHTGREAALDVAPDTGARFTQLYAQTTNAIRTRTSTGRDPALLCRLRVGRARPRVHAAVAPRRSCQGRCRLTPNRRFKQTHPYATSRGRRDLYNQAPRQITRLALESRWVRPKRREKVNSAPAWIGPDDLFLDQPERAGIFAGPSDANHSPGRHGTHDGRHGPHRCGTPGVPAPGAQHGDQPALV